MLINYKSLKYRRVFLGIASFFVSWTQFNTETQATKNQFLWHICYGGFPSCYNCRLRLISRHWIFKSFINEKADLSINHQILQKSPLLSSHLLMQHVWNLKFFRTKNTWNLYVLTDNTLKSFFIIQYRRQSNDYYKKNNTYDK